MNDDPLSSIKARLHNWARWARHDAMPNLDAKLTSIWSHWIPARGWDAGWGDVGPPEESPRGIDIMDEELIDHHVVWLNFAHRTTIKAHFFDHNGQKREQVDEACRALEDMMR